MSDDQSPPEPQTEKLVKADTSTSFVKLLLQVAAVFVPTKSGLPFINNMVDEFGICAYLDSAANRQIRVCVFK